MSNEYLEGSFSSMLEHTVNRVLRGAGKAPHIVLGPVVWQPDGAGRRWYFAVASGKQPRGFRVDQIAAGTRELAEEIRAALWMALLQHRPIILHDTDDELQMARLCAAIWPCKKTEKIVAGIEAERRGFGQAVNILDMQPAGRA
jgi:hypothetical protein